MQETQSAQVHGLRTDSPSALAHHRALVYHKAYTLLFSDLKSAVEFGYYLNSHAFNLNIKGHPICMVASCDYEEMYDLSLSPSEDSEG